MATEKISEIEYSLGEKNTILDRFFELGSHCVLDAENWKFFRTLRIGSSTGITFFRSVRTKYLISPSSSRAHEKNKRQDKNNPLLGQRMVL